MSEAKKKGLGRGLGALLSKAPAPPAAGGERTVPIDDIAPSRWQPRTQFDEERIAELAQSIREHGILQPLLVRARPGGGYELIAGERRLRAARVAGLASVPVRLQERGDREALELALIENLQREDLSALDEAAGYQRLVDDFDLSQEDVARRVGKSRPAVANTLRLLNLPEAVRHELRAGRLSAGHARALLALPNAAEQIGLAHLAVRQALSVRALEARIRQTLESRTRGAARPARDVHAADLEKQLMRALGTRVTIRTKKGGRAGSIVIAFNDLDELSRLTARFRGH